MQQLECRFDPGFIVRTGHVTQKVFADWRNLSRGQLERKFGKVLKVESFHGIKIHNT